MLEGIEAVTWLSQCSEHLFFLQLQLEALPTTENQVRQLDSSFRKLYHYYK